MKYQYFADYYLCYRVNSKWYHEESSNISSINKIITYQAIVFFDLPLFSLCRKNEKDIYNTYTNNKM